MTVIFKWQESEMRALVESCARDDAAPILDRHFPAGARLLESGCGAGRWVRFLQDRGRAMVGLEYSRETVAMVKRNWPDLDIIEGDCERSPFPDGTFDGALSFGVVEHWIDGPERPLRELLRVLKPGGKAYISVPVWNTIRRLKNAVWWDEVTQAPKALALRILRGTPKGRELARRLNVRFLVVNPTCVSDNGKLERPPQLGTPLFVSDKLVVMKLVGGSS